MAITGQIVSVGDHVDVSYSGGVQQYEIPFNGLYQLEVWGSNAYNDSGSYARGGYSKGYKFFEKGTIVYICCGGKPYNGGATSSGCTSGGATHMALVSGTLASIGYTEFVTNNKGLIVAGGAGAKGYYAGYGDDGATGGGTSGGVARYSIYGGITAGVAGTQTTGYAFGQGQSTSENGAGGGGFYGGSVTRPNDGCRAGGGGSGWIGGVPEITYKGTTYTPETTNDANGDNGKATITFFAKSFPTIYLGENQIDGGHLGGLDLETIYLGENELA